MCPGRSLRIPGVLISTPLLLTLGLGLRLFHYARNPSMWHDEAALVLNVIGKSFGELLGPLFFAEAAPPLFLWVERTLRLLLGDGTYALRLLPFVASCAALLLFVAVARRLLSRRAVPWAIFLFACSDQLLWHASEAKPYSVDVLAAVGLLYLFLSLRSWPLARQFMLYTLLAPLLIFLVYPGCFLLGGLLLALLPALARSRKFVDWLAYGVLTLTVVGSFALLFVGPIHAQRCDSMEQCWTEGFPPYDQPWKVPAWVLLSSVDVVRYCSEPAGGLLAVLVLVGAALLLKRGKRAILLLLLTPVGLAFVAALARAYPWGGSRVVVYAAPPLLLLMAEGIAFGLVWLRAEAGSPVRGWPSFVWLP